MSYISIGFYTKPPVFKDHKVFAATVKRFVDEMHDLLGITSNVMVNIITNDKESYAVTPKEK